MDFGAYIVSSLFGLGKNLNQGRQEREPKYKTNPINSHETNGTNIYSSRDYYKVEGLEAKKVIENWEAAKDPLRTNIIPMFFNTLYTKSDVEKIPNAKYDKDLIFSVLSDLDDDAKKLVLAKRADPEYIMKHVTDGARSIPNDWAVI